MPGRKPPDHPITSAASVLRLYWIVFRNPRFRRRYLRLIGNIFRIYFKPQFFRRRGHTRIPLDMELDGLVPFDPTWLPCYLGFVRLWVGSLGWLHVRFGDRALPEMEAFVAGLETLFLEAHKIFSQRDSTVASRPGPLPSLESLIIHLSDRNSFCFPSLHVMIARYNARRIGASLDRLGGPGEDFSAEKAFLEERALRIVESIIHVKQHSLSDIPAGLFLLHTLSAEGEARNGDEAEDDLRFLERLFLEAEKTEPGADGERGRKLRSFMGAMYRRLHHAHRSGRNPHAVLLDFLGNYREEVGILLKNLG
ncbi:MAG: hypothetical protein JWO30_473 [Fibrobacteres bacterium]|nr:hypothetical protein [Fibrobacterota bacterium]